MKTGWIKIVGIFLCLFLAIGVLSTPGAVSLAGQGDASDPIELGPEGALPQPPDSDAEVSLPTSGNEMGEFGSAGSLCTVAVMGATIGAEPWLNDVKSKLVGTKQFIAVDIYNLITTTPSLATMQQYDAVLVFSGEKPVDKILLGDNLANYIDSGGGVVTAYASNVSGLGPEGRFNTQNYWALPPAPNYNNWSQSGLGTVHDPDHPVMKGVSEIDGGSGSHRTVGQSPHPNAVVLADWLDGNHMVAVREDLARKRVDLNFYPVSADANSISWPSNKDGARLIANALSWVGECTPPPILYLPVSVRHPEQAAYWEDFSADPNLGDAWTIYRGTDDAAAEAWWDEPAEVFYLTTATKEKSAAVFADFALPPDTWTVEFDYRIGGGIGSTGDGFTFMFYKDEGSFAVNPPGVGGTLGFQTSMAVPAPGYGIEFDSVPNPSNFDPAGAHIAVIDDSVDQHLVNVLSQHAGSGSWHHALIRYDMGAVEVWVDGARLLFYIIAAPDTQYTGVGFSAGTGWYTNQHVIDNFRIYVP